MARPILYCAAIIVLFFSILGVFNFIDYTIYDNQHQNQILMYEYYDGWNDSLNVMTDYLNGVEHIKAVEKYDKYGMMINAYKEGE